MENDSAYGPFEGPEKLLEVWFAPSPDQLPDASEATDGRFGLRKVPKAVWEEMLDIVRCKILSHVEGAEMDAYLLRCVIPLVAYRRNLCGHIRISTSSKSIAIILLF